MYNTFNPEQSKDGDDEMRRLHVECGEPVRVSAVLCGSEGGTGSDVEKSEHMLTLRNFLSVSLIDRCSGSTLSREHYLMCNTWNSSAACLPCTYFLFFTFFYAFLFLYSSFSLTLVTLFVV